MWLKTSFWTSATNKQTDNADSYLAFTTKKIPSFYYDSFLCNFSFKMIIPWDTSMMIQAGPSLHFKEAWYNEFQYHMRKRHQTGLFTCTFHASIIFDISTNCIMLLSRSELILNVSWYNQGKNLNYYLKIVCSVENRVQYKLYCTCLPALPTPVLLNSYSQYCRVESFLVWTACTLMGKSNHQ